MSRSVQWRGLPPIFAGFVAVVISIVRRIAPLLLEVSASVPSPRTHSLAVLVGRFAVFVLAYGALFGLAFWIGARHADTGTRLALATGAVAAFFYLSSRRESRRLRRE